MHAKAKDKPGAPAGRTAGIPVSPAELPPRTEEVDLSLSGLFDDLYDLFPYPWSDPEAFEQGVDLCFNGRAEAAVKVYHELLERDPKAYPAHHLLGYFYGCVGNHKEEIECYKKTIKLKPDYAQIHLSLGVAYWLYGKERKALDAFLEAIPMAPEFALAERWFTVIFERMGRFRGFNGKGMNLKTHVMANAHYLLGAAYEECGFNNSARNAFKKTVRIHPEFADAYYQLGEIHIKKLRNPKRAEKYLGLAEKLYAAQNDGQRSDLARQLLYRKTIADKEPAAEEWLKEGMRLHKMGRYRAAVDAYRMAIFFRETFLEAHYNMGIALGCLADAGGEPIERAIWAFKDSIRIKPDYIHAHIGLGASYIKNRQMPEAIEVLTQARTVDPKDASVLYYLGVAYRMASRREEAIEALKKSVHLKADSVQALYDLALTYLDCDRVTEACGALEEAVRLKPDFAAGQYMLGNLYYIKTAEVEKALTHLKKAERLYLKLEDHQQAYRIRQLLMHYPE
jgi:tetratricopeptide (TPR) repeat protein